MDQPRDVRNNEGNTLSIRVNENSLVRDFLGTASENRLFLINGKSGIGKTSLASRHLDDSRFAIIQAKFTESTFSNPVNEMILQVINHILEDERSCGIKWKAKLLNVDLSNFVINSPELGALLGKEPKKNTIDIQSALTFRQTIKTLFRQYSKHGNKPLLSFFDDMQWASRDTVELIFEFAKDLLIGGKIIGTYRSEIEYVELHNYLANELSSPQLAHTSIKLEGLNDADSACFARAKAENAGLDVTSIDMTLVIKNAGGNPFTIFENILSVSHQRIQDLYETEKRLLLVASVLGFSFQRSLLELVLESSYHSIIDRLVASEIFQIDSDDTIRFGHDQFFQQTLALSNSSERSVVCDYVASNLLTQKSAFANLITDDLIASVVLGAGEFRNTLEPTALVALLTLGAKEAAKCKNHRLRRTISWEAISILQLHEISKKEMTEACKEAAISSYYYGELKDMEYAIAIITDSDCEMADKLEAYLILVDGYISKNKMNSAIEKAITGLKLLNISIPRKHKWYMFPRTIFYSIPLMILMMASKSILKTNPALSRVESTRSALLSRILTACYQTDFFLAAYPLFHQIQGSYRNGATPETSVSVAMLGGGLICGATKQISLSGYFKTVSHRLQAVSSNSYNIPRTQFIWLAFKDVHTDCISKNVAEMDECFHQNVKEDSIDIAAYAAHCAAFHGLDSELSLSELKNRIEDYRKTLGNYEQINADCWIRIVYQFAIDLEQSSPPNEVLNGSAFNFKNEISKAIEKDDRSAIFIANHYAGVLLFLYQRYQEADAHFCQARKYIDGVRGTYGETLIYFYHAMTKYMIHINGGQSANCMLERAFLKHMVKQGSIVSKSKLTLVTAMRQLCDNNVKSAKTLLQKGADEALENGHRMDEIVAHMILLRLEQSQEQQETLDSLIEAWGGLSLVEPKRGGLTAKTLELLSTTNELSLTSLQGLFSQALEVTEIEYNDKHSQPTRWAIVGEKTALTINGVCTFIFKLKHSLTLDQTEDINHAIDIIELFSHQTSTNLLAKNDEDNYRKGYELSPIGLFSASNNGQITLANMQAIELLGFASTSPPSTVDELLSGTNMSADIITKINAHHGINHEIETETYCSTSSLNLLLNITGTETGIHGSVEDATDRVEKRRLAQRNLQYANTLAGTVHDINNQLPTVIDWNTRVLSEAEAIGNEKIISLIKNQRKVIAATKVILDDTKQLTKVEHGGEPKFTPFSPVLLCRGLIEQLGYNEIPMILTSNLPDDAEIISDRALISSIVANMITNVLRHAHASHLDIEVLHENNVLTFTFDDDGVGINNEIIRDLFTFGITTSPDGTGIGLHRCKEFAECLGGSLVLLEKENGCKFTMALPKTYRDIKATVGAPTPPKVNHMTRALIVEDEPMICRMYKEWLHELDMDIAQSGQEAFEYANNKDYDIILVDYRLGDMTGAELIHSFMEGRNSDTQIIATSGNSDYAKPLINAGANYFVEKGLPEDLNNTIEYARKVAENRMNKEMAKTFHGDYADFIEKLTTTFEQEDWPLLSRTVHSLHSLCKIYLPYYAPEILNIKNNCENKTVTVEILKKVTEIFRLVYKRVETLQ